MEKRCRIFKLLMASSILSILCIFFFIYKLISFNFFLKCQWNQLKGKARKGFRVFIEDVYTSNWRLNQDWVSTSSVASLELRLRGSGLSCGSYTKKLISHTFRIALYEPQRRYIFNLEPQTKTCNAALFEERYKNYLTIFLFWFRKWHS